MKSLVLDAFGMTFHFLFARVLRGCCLDCSCFCDISVGLRHCRLLDWGLRRVSRKARRMPRISERRRLQRDSEVMAYFLDTAVSCCQAISEVSGQRFPCVCWPKIRRGLDCHSLDFYLNYFLNAYGLWHLGAAELKKYFATTVFGAKTFFHREIQIQRSCLGNEVLEVEEAVVRPMRTLHLQAPVEEMGEASPDLAVAPERAAQKQLADEVSWGVARAPSHRQRWMDRL